MYEVLPRRGFSHPSMISVWNGPRRTLSHTVTSSLTLTSGDPPLAPSTGVSAPSEVGMAMPNWQGSSCPTLVVDHSMVRLSISLSQITLISLLIVQVPTTKRTLHPKSDSSGTTRNTVSSSYPAIPHTCMRKMTNPSGLVHIPPSPMRFTGRTGNPHCCTRVGVIVFTSLPLSARALKFLPSTVNSTSVSGPCQCAVGPPAFNCGFQTRPIMQTFTSGWECAALGVGEPFSPALWNLLALDAIT